jgi:hypothetical protein
MPGLILYDVYRYGVLIMRIFPFYDLSSRQGILQLILTGLSVIIITACSQVMSSFYLDQFTNNIVNGIRILFSVLLIIQFYLAFMRRVVISEHGVEFKDPIRRFIMTWDEIKKIGGFRAYKNNTYAVSLDALQEKKFMETGYIFFSTVDEPEFGALLRINKNFIYCQYRRDIVDTVRKYSENLL